LNYVENDNLDILPMHMIFLCIDIQR